MRRQVIFYKTESGKCPVVEFLDTVPGKVAQKITWTLTLLEELDAIPQTYLKKLVNTEGIWEIRIGRKRCLSHLLLFRQWIGSHADTRFGKKDTKDTDSRNKKSGSF